MRFQEPRGATCAACLFALLFCGCQSSQTAASPGQTQTRGAAIDSGPAASTATPAGSATPAANPVSGTRQLPSDPAARAKLAVDVPAPKGEGKFQAISFAQLSGFAYETDEQGRLTPRCKVPAAIRDLDEETVALAGFMVPIEFEDDKVSSLILVRDQLLCCFGQQPKLNEWVYVNADPPVTAITDTPVTLYGKFHARPDFEGDQIEKEIGDGSLILGIGRQLGLLEHLSRAGQLEKSRSVDHGDQGVEPSERRKRRSVRGRHVKSHGHRQRLRNPRGLDEKEIIFALPGQPFHLDQKVVAQRAADAAVAQLHQALFGSAQGRFPASQQARVDSDLAHVVDDHGHATAFAVGQEMAQQSGLTRSQESGEQNNG